MGQSHLYSESEWDRLGCGPLPENRRLSSDFSGGANSAPAPTARAATPASSTQPQPLTDRDWERVVGIGRRP